VVVEFSLMIGLVAVASVMAILYNIRIYRRCVRAIRERRAKVYESAVLGRLERNIRTSGSQQRFER